MSYIADENSFLKRAHDTRNTGETRAFYNRAGRRPTIPT